MTKEESGRDWRLDLGPEDLAGVTLVMKRYRSWSESWEHEHCSYCTAKFLDRQFSDEHALEVEQNPEVQTTGYVVESSAANDTTQADRWICKTCADDFRERFDWTLVVAEPLPESATESTTRST